MLTLLLDAVSVAFFGTIWLARRKGVKVGDGCRIYVSRWGSEPYLISIGDRVTISSGTRFLTHDGSLWLLRKQDQGRLFRYAPIAVGSDVFIGTNSILLPGVRIGSRVVIGAGSVVTRHVPDDTVVAGNPARVISSFADFEARKLATSVSDADLKDAPDQKGRVERAVALIEAKLAKNGNG